MTYTYTYKYIAIDFETYLIDANSIVPKPVCLSYYSEDMQGVILASEVRDFLISIPSDTIIIAHNLKFELGVIYKYFDLKDWIWDRLDKELFYDTLISEKLLDLARTGEFTKYSLDVLVQRYLKKDISSTKTDGWRLKYNELDNIPVSEWPSEAYDYALNDSIYTYKIAEMQKYVNDPLSIRADFILSLATSYGFNIDKDVVSNLETTLIEKMKPFKQVMIDTDFAYYDKKGVFKKRSKKLREHIEAINVDAEKTAKGAIAISSKALKQYNTDEIISAFYNIAKLEKLSTAFVPRLKDAAEKNGTIHPGFNCLVSTGRTSSIASNLFPSCNIQQMPRDGGVRECFIPRPGHSLISIDYSALELHSVGQQLMNFLGTSKHTEQINYGEYPVDLHSFLGSKLMSIDKGTTVTYEEFISRKKEDEFKKFRKLAKPVGLGFPGGLGPDKFVDFALNTYGVSFTLDEATRLRELYHEIYPDFSYFMKSFSRKYRTNKKVRLKLDTKDENNDYMYRYVDEYFYVIGNRARRGCTFTSFTNGVLMQSLSADGAKIASYNVSKYLEKNKLGKVLAFIHDEIIFETLKNDDTHKIIEDVSYIMCESMREVMPDLRITVESSEMAERWTKDGPFAFNGLFWINNVGIRGKKID